MRRFILGHGAMKAGTTQLHEYIKGDPLYRSPRFLTGWYEKEMQFWHNYTKAYIVDKKAYRPTTRQKFITLWRVRHVVPSRLYLWFLWRRMHKTQGNYYFTYYAKLLKNGGIASDLTPGYALLSKEICRRIMSDFEAQGISFRAVHIARDPVKRAVSHFASDRFQPVNRERWVEQVLGLPRDADLHQAFCAHCHLEYPKAMSDYKKIIDTMVAAYPEEKRMFVLFEEMIRGIKLRELSDFLGMSYRPDAIGAPVNAQKRSVVLDEDVLQKCAQLYRPTYEAMAKIFPQTETLWSGWKYLR